MDRVVAAFRIHQVVARGAGEVVPGIRQLIDEVQGNFAGVPHRAVVEHDPFDSGAREMATHNDLVRAARCAHQQVIQVPNVHQSTWHRATANAQRVDRGDGQIAVGNHVLSAPWRPEIGVAASPANQAVVARSAVNAVDRVGAHQRVSANRPCDIEPLRNQLRIAQHRTVRKLEVVDRRRAERIVRVEPVDAHHVPRARADGEYQGRVDAELHVGRADAGAEHDAVGRGSAVHVGLGTRVDDAVGPVAQAVEVAVVAAAAAQRVVAAPP